MLFTRYTIQAGASDRQISRHITNLFWFAYEDAERDPSFGEGKLSARGEAAATRIEDVLSLLRFHTERRRNAPRMHVLRDHMAFLCAIWLALTGEMPEGYFPAPEVSGPPIMHSGAGFCYLMLQAAGCTFTAEEFRASFVWACKRVRRKRPIIEALASL